MANSDNSRQSMLSIPARWGELYFNFFAGLCVAGEALVIYHGIARRPPDADALDITVDIMLRIAAIPIFAALQAFLIMRGRDLLMKTWETFRMERYNKGREDGIEEGIEIGTKLAIREMRERLARREESERGERDDWLDEILSELSENGGGGEKRRPRN